ncbi:uncharacterized protein [Watersipora subatra]|uniref:uncharacterized protein n=1 Tax=Watersipora subatra TaxID=2589382 RepID=UPI00355B2584
MIDPVPGGVWPVILRAIPPSLQSNGATRIESRSKVRPMADPVLAGVKRHSSDQANLFSFEFSAELCYSSTNLSTSTTRSTTAMSLPQPFLYHSYEFLFLFYKNRLKEAFEKAFGNKASVPASNATRCNSTFQQVLAVINLGREKLNEVLAVEHNNSVMSVSEWGQLKELVTILGPFAQATDPTQGDKVVTISMVAPSVVGLHKHAVVMNNAGQYLNKLSAALCDSLARSFADIAVTNKPFGHELYIIAAVLDPRHLTQWLPEDDEELELKIRRQVIDAAGREYKEPLEAAADVNNEVNVPAAADVEDAAEEPVFRLPWLFDYHQEENIPVTTSNPNTVLTISGQFTMYLELARSTPMAASDPLVFWDRKREILFKLYSLAQKVLSVPASSAALERIFSHGGILMRPHRASMSDAVLENLIFCKCNRLQGLV